MSNKSILRVTQGLCLILSAPSGSGKTTIKDRLVDRYPFTYSVSYTTRKPRSGEVDGVDYHFVSEDQFRVMIQNNQFLEWAEVHGAYYGTGVDTIERVQSGEHVLLDIDVQGGDQVKTSYPEAVSVFVLPPSWSALQKRLYARNTDDEATIQRRLANAKQEIEYYTHYDYVVVNDDLEQVMEELAAIIFVERHSTKRMEVNQDAFFNA